MVDIRILFCAFVLSGSLATGTTITLSGDTDPTCPAGAICIATNTFDIPIDAAGGGFFQVVNQTTTTIDSLIFDLPYFDGNCPGGTPASPTLTISSSFIQDYGTSGLSFNTSQTCGASTGTANYMLTLTFLPGIQTNFQFFVDLNTGGPTVDGGGWVAGDTVNSDSSSDAPEPGTLAVALGGLGSILLLKRFTGRAS
jgi:hypothetical protein